MLMRCHTTPDWLQHWVPGHFAPQACLPHCSPAVSVMNCNTKSIVEANAGSILCPYVPSACYGYDQGHFRGNMHFVGGGDSGSANILNHGENCGKTFWIQCQGHGCRGSGAITVKVVDRCPGRALDLSSEVFVAIADPDVGDITVKYSLA